MSMNSLLLISEDGLDSSSILVDISSSVSDMVIWVASEPPDVISKVIDAYDLKGRIHVLSLIQSRKYKSVNVNNLSEIGILLSKISEGMEDFVVLMTAIPELLLIHGLERTYVFLMNVIGKTTNQGRKFIGGITKDAQNKRDEIMISRLFSIVLRYRKWLEGEKWVRNLIIETPIGDLDKDVVELYLRENRIVIPKNVKDAIVHELMD
ncbi:hypothetical protein Asulf_01731 [Archaeoglobus sulfaticallidus PM70-1]|uniref:KaiC-like domain-containing protein n=1 Tax=Archaeoglobus sulfaticallidus PM70-1 TaxID=387631 RepID=N0BHB1_9EURY|nr:hypothetical protein [Archaeoglobus sulfaticallidus]AGK61702.1 hypothetical protein Asulf_01731 [Archaeoglobus sulfaticallidus PM70-1]